MGRKFVDGLDEARIGDSMMQNREVVRLSIVEKDNVMRLF